MHLLIECTIKKQYKQKSKINSYKNEFHISGQLRQKYEFDEELFSINGNVLFADFSAVRKFVDKLNSKRKTEDHVQVGQVNAVGLIDELYHFILHEYEKSENLGVLKRAVDHLNNNIGKDKLYAIILEFTNLFPPLDVFKDKITAEKYLESYTEERANYEIALEELLLLYFTNYNPASQKLRELFSDEYFENRNVYLELINELNEFFKTQIPFGPDNQDIFTFLKTPIDSNPDNLWDQLEFMRIKWEVIIKDFFDNRILSSKDLMKEDIKFENFSGGGPPPTVVPAYKGQISGAEKLVLGKSLYKYAEEIEKDYEEPEKFTPDIHWMPRVVLMAKNIYVWLDQLSKQYDKEIKRLDQIPDQELDKLAEWNLTGLWLIGLWKRSPASKRIKHIMGNIDAVSSAYSLYDYKISDDLGGELAYDNLNQRAKLRGIRLASDMVPNHTGVYSDWVIAYPEYFIQTSKSPFPNYKFTGENLSPIPGIEIRIEDGFYSKSDASVVFQRIDTRNGEVRYIYHGNDGTNMPWNDTAQLDMIKEEVREAVIQKILDVAKKFSIIRFDAAMTLTKRHFSRLWYPQPGKGGDIPSRSDYSMKKADFDKLFPEEFWREVVERINKEKPDTLLLAEAFWLMEGYFVRSLGMHRVYNSAFMNMLMNEENEKYRNLITNTMEFEPEILKRYVNFMSNPDEETSIKQFGTDDKYFGVLTLMVTLPGLPMFAHGQIEGYTEKYGMEYQRAYYKETPKEWLVKRHEEEIFPLMKRRYLFAEIENFWIFDCIDEDGIVNENVYAYTNSYENYKALVLYNNQFESASGKIKLSSPKLVGDDKNSRGLRKKSIANVLGINPGTTFYYISFNQKTKLEYLFKGQEIVDNGFSIQLDGFENNVFLGFKEVNDVNGEYEQLYRKLEKEGVPSINISLEQQKLNPIHDAFEKIFNEKEIKVLVKNSVINIIDENDIEDELKFITNKYYYFLNQIIEHRSISLKIERICIDFKIYLSMMKILNIVLDRNLDQKLKIKYPGLADSIIISQHSNYRENYILSLMWLCLFSLDELMTESKQDSSGIFDDLLLSFPIENILNKLGRGEEGIIRESTLLRTLLNSDRELFALNKKYIIAENQDDNDLNELILTDQRELLIEILNNDDTKSFMLVNHYENIWYYSKERFEELIDWLFTISIFDYMKKLYKHKILISKKENIIDDKSDCNSFPGVDKSIQSFILADKELLNYILRLYSVNVYFKECSETSEYKFEKLLKSLVGEKPKV
ncbi:alpha-amylase family glycosyl hydrolase [Bacteroidota bacterium]